jgi:hypothetical protein
LAIAEGRTPAALAHTLHRDRAAITSHFDDPLGNDFAVEGVTKLALVRIRNAALCVTAKLAADVRFGSFATEALEALPQWMSASPPKATVGHLGGISSLSVPLAEVQSADLLGLFSLLQQLDDLAGTADEKSDQWTDCAVFHHDDPYGSTLIRQFHRQNFQSGATAAELHSGTRQ